MSVTLRDVARAAGVSTATASRALARPTVVSEALRGRILAAVRRLGYSPNLAAKALASHRSGFAGMLVDSLLEPFSAALITALERELGRAGYTVVIGTTEGNAERAAACTREMLGRGVEALFSWNVALEPEAVQKAAARATPWLVFDDATRFEGPLAVSSGRRSGAELACRYLLSLGHARFGLVAVPGHAVQEAIAEALAGTGASLRTNLLPTAADVDAAQACAGALLDHPEAPTAILCGNDLLAVAVLRACQLRGRSVPREVSVVGFGDSALARCAAPPLTSVRVSPEEVALRAAQALFLSLEGRAPSVVTPSLKLVVRESTGASPRR